MYRRAFLGTLAGSLLGARGLAEAQQAAGKVWRIGYVSPGDAYNQIEQVFDQSMKDLRMEAGCGMYPRVTIL
jgi:hypothetical protein